jgi:murein DD-endopeptidase MepM/ murein hydrolase activator NlpD
MYVRRGLGQQQLTAPISGTPTVSSLFGPRAAPVAGASTEHQGIDYAVPVGTPVLAAGDGTVIFAGVQSGFGNTVVINNGNGVTTLYGHLSSIGVNVGQTVGDGDQIALSGASGTVSGPNLHFGVYENGVAVDPTSQLAPDVTDLTADDYASMDTFSSDLSSLSTDLSDDVSSLTSGADPVMLGAAALLMAGLIYAISA